MADYLPPVVAKLTGDDSGLTATLTRAKDKVKRWAVDVGKTKVTLKVEAQLKAGAMAELRRQVKDSPAAQIKIRLDLAAGERDRIRRLVTDPPPTMKVKLGLVTGAKADLAERLKQNAVEVKVKPVMDQVALRRVSVVLRELGKRIDVSIRPRMDDATQLRTQTLLDRLSRDRIVTIRTRTIGGGTPGGSSGSGGGGMLAAVIPFAPALAPIAAGAMSVVASVGAATAAVGVFGLAAISQVKNLGNAATAQQKYNTAVAKYGPLSKQAATAQQGVSTALEGMPAATQRAAMGYLGLKDAFKSWSNGLSKFTMDPVNKGFVVAEGILPKLSPMVKGVSGELDRLMTVAAGGVTTPGFDSMMSRFTKFADGALKHGVDDVIHFSRVLSEGGGGRGAVASFMQYAHDQGPAVREVLKNIARAISTVAQGSAQAGPGMLTVVNAVAKLVASLPPAFVGRVLQVLAALKLYKLASSGIASVGGSLTNLSTRLLSLRSAAAAAGGGMAGMRAAIATISTGTKVAGAVAVVAALALVAKHFSDEAKQAHISADVMSASLKGIATGDSGSLSTLLRQLTTDSGNLHQSFTQRLKSNDSLWDIITNSGAKSSSANKDYQQLGATLADMVKAGDASTAAKALGEITAAGQKIPVKYLKAYNSALADQAFEAKIAADAQGSFGRQAQQVQKQLDKQKQAAQGLQQAILDLNDANRAALDAESAYQQAIDDATAAIKNHHHALTMSNGQLDLGTKAARDAYGALSQLAATAEASSVATLQQTGSQEKANRVLIDAHARLVATAEKMGLNTQKAHQLADSLDNIKDPKIQVTVKTMQAEANLAAAQKKVNAFPKSTRTDANFAYQRALSDLRYYQRQVDLLHGKSIAVNIVTTHSSTGVVAHEGGLYPQANGSVVSRGVRRMAAGGFGRPAMMARGGSRVLWAEGGDESYIPHDRRPRSKAIAEQTVGIMGGAVSWGGGSPAASTAPLGAQVAKGLWAGMSGQSAWLASQARAFALKTIPQPIADALGIHSPSRVAITLGRWVAFGLVQGLTGSTASVKAATLRLSRSIMQVFHDDAARQLAADRKKLDSLNNVRIPSPPRRGRGGRRGPSPAAVARTEAARKRLAKSKADVLADLRHQQGVLGQDSGIARFVAVDNARLLRLASMRDAVAGKLKAAQSKLNALQAAWTTEKNNISSSIMSSASIITASPDAARSVNSFDVVTQMRQKVQQAEQFAAELAQLKKKGLRSDLIEQLASAGVDQAGATAQALAGGTAGQIAEMNRLQKGLKTTADATGTTVADAMYGAGIASAKGLIKGLQSQEKAIDAQMLRIAKSMQKAIRDALGIHSPSRVMAVDGEFTGRGFALGLDRSSKHVRIAAQGLAMSARQGATITGGYNRGHAGGAMAGGGATYVQNFYVNVEGSVTTERKLVDTIEIELTTRARRSPGGFQPASPWNARRGG